MLKHIPNTLTVIRLLFIPAIVFYILTGNYILAFVFFTISGITDIADGFIARKFNLVSNFGKLMDPLADKLTQISTLASLVFADIIPIYSRWYGKLATVLLYFAIVVSLLLKQFEISGFWGFIDLGIFALALAATIFSLIMYVRDLYQKGFIDKQDLKKEVTVDKKERKKKA